MVSLTVVFWMYVILFAIIGGMRGWARELLVAFSVILALTFTTLLENYVTFIRDVLKPDSPSLYFWLRSMVVVLLVFFGYQTPNIPRFAAKMNREKIQDVLLGIFIGALNGYLIVGTLWFYMYEAGYPFQVIAPPPVGSQFEKVALAMLQYMPPKILGIPGIYFAVVVAFIFVIVVFI
ncbi:MAG: CvpA family protein [Chloroflexi bacterium]|nr:CvpA family protein [Chloroflexota bacterium]